MSTTAQQMRAWSGPALLTHGFRPFFLGAAVWAALAMLVWVLALSGRISLPTAFDAVSWHAHEFLFGYVSAVIAGFLLTAVPNWTGRLPIVGWPLGGLFALWVAGRLAVGFSSHMPPAAVAAIDLAMPVVLWAVIAREIFAGKNWRNLVVLGLLTIFAAANAIFHFEAAHGIYAAQGLGLRLGLSAALMMIAFVGGRIVPSFTRNWLVRRDAGRLPVSPMQRLDQAALAALFLALAVWTAAPLSAGAGYLLLAAGLIHLARLARWAGERTAAEPLVWVLHAGYFFLPLGALAMGGAILMPELLAPAAAQHLWMAGAIGLMTLAVMTRATLGHTGQELAAGPGTTALYISLVIAVLARIAAGIWPGQSGLAHMLAGFAWIAAFGGFAVLYGPLLLKPKPGR